MNDPWHQDTLGGLVAAIEATRAGGGTAYAVVVVSSERLGGEVVGELRTRLGGAESLRVCTYVDPRDAVRGRLDEPQQEEFRTTVIQGLSAVLESERGKGLLNWLNFRREAFSRPREAFVFVLTREAADLWAKLGRRDPHVAREQALQALDLIRTCDARLYEPAALLALAAAERALGNADTAEVTDRRWRRLVGGIDAKGLEASLERDAAWAAAQAD